MAERTTAAPIAMLTQTQWRDTVSLWVGVTFANLSTKLQTELDRYINEAHEYVLQRFNHQPWGQRQVLGTTVPLVTGQIVLPADVRHIIALRETDSEGVTRPVVNSTLTNFYTASATVDGVTHPFDINDAPTYFFLSMDDQNPPQQIWQRRPIPTATVTVDIVFRPYFGVIETDQFAGLPADVVTIIRHHIRSQWAALQKDYELSNNERQQREDHITAVQMSDAPDGSEAIIAPQPSSEFFREMGGRF